VFWILAQRLADVPERAQRGFLVSTAVRVAADRRRSKWHRAVDTGLEVEDRPSQARCLDEQLDLQRAAQLLDRALGTLDEGDRAIYVMAELEQLSRTEVAEALMIPKGTVASRLRRAREAFELAVRRLHRGGRP
jgi:RNA polymerase sigma-70 factor (ECF subfamily)